MLSHSEKLVLAHRYLYYVLARPVLSDRLYDRMESLLPVDSTVRQSVGSDRAEDYSDEVKQLAQSLL